MSQILNFKLKIYIFLNFCHICDIITAYVDSNIHKLATVCVFEWLEFDDLMGYQTFPVRGIGALTGFSVHSV